MEEEDYITWKKKGMSNVDLMEFINEYHEDVAMIVRTGNIISFHCKDNVKVQKAFRTQELAIKYYKIFLDEFERCRVK